MTGNEAKVGKV